MNTEALIRLADKLDGVGPYAKDGPIPAERFDLTVWQCDTVACACGWAAQDIWFNERGFSLGMSGVSVPTIRFKSEDHDAEYGIFAVMSFFEISDRHASRLFLCKAYPLGRGAPSHVSQRIRKFVETGTC